MLWVRRTSLSQVFLLPAQDLKFSLSLQIRSDLDLAPYRQLIEGVPWSFQCINTISIYAVGIFQGDVRLWWKFLSQRTEGEFLIPLVLQCLWRNNNKSVEGNIEISTEKYIYSFSKYSIRVYKVYCSTLIEDAGMFIGLLFWMAMMVAEWCLPMVFVSWTKFMMNWKNSSSTSFLCEDRAWRGIFKSKMTKTWKTSSSLCSLLPDQWKSEPNWYTADVSNKQNLSWSFLCGSHLVSQKNRGCSWTSVPAQEV